MAEICIWLETDDIECGWLSTYLFFLHKNTQNNHKNTWKNTLLQKISLEKRTLVTYTQLLQHSLFFFFSPPSSTEDTLC